MKNFHLTAFFVINFIITSNAQTNPTCLVKYKEYKRPHTGTWNYWYSNDNQISKRESNYRTMYMRGFPVLLNEGMTTQTDTIKYNKEFNEFVSEAIENNKKIPEIIFKMNSNSNVKMMTYYEDYLKKDYVVLDTLNKTENWEILSDTATILGFKCQQAQ